MNGSSITASAHAKVILLGEHAVVYGFPALVAPLPGLFAAATARPEPGPVRLTTRYGDGPLNMVPREIRGLVDLVLATLNTLRADPAGLHLTVDASIPPGIGLGSSAAVAVAIVRALYRTQGTELRPNTLLELAGIAERFAHGTPSGLDVWAVSTSVPLWYVRGKPPKPLQVPHPISLVVADSGVPSHTRDAVRLIRERLRRSRRDTWDLLERLGQLAGDMRTALTAGALQRLGEGLNRGQETLETIGLGHPETGRLVSQALRMGALGAKGTGGGLGGSVVALARDPVQASALQEALLAAGAHHAWATSIGGGPK